MCINISATDGLLSIALASSPPPGRARSRFTRMVLLRSHESSRASSRRWSGASDIPTPFVDARIGTNSTRALSLSGRHILDMFRISGAPDRNLRSGAFDFAQVVWGELDRNRSDIFIQ